MLPPFASADDDDADVSMEKYAGINRSLSDLSPPAEAPSERESEFWTRWAWRRRLRSRDVI